MGSEDDRDRGPDSPVELKARALRLLARREHSRAELARKLASHAASREALDTVLDGLEQKKQLSDERYAEQRVRTLARKYGSGRIRRELRARGVNDAAAASAVRATAEEDLSRAVEILRRKYRVPAASREERAKRMRFLQGRGFSYEIIQRALSLSSEAQS